MAHGINFRTKDEELTKTFLDDHINDFNGEKVLDICGGIGRNGKLLKHHFNKIDILDLYPSFGQIPKENQGRLI